MNFKVIQQKHPLAYREWRREALRIEPRDLYDHFDALGIKVWVEPDGNEWEARVGFIMGGHVKANIYDGYPTRPLAEAAAFEKAFEIREEQLAQVSAKT